MFDLEIVLIILFFLMGISVGSFLNVVADRVPLGQSIISPPSHCFSCRHSLEWRDMVPVVSYIALRGKCRYCGTAFSSRSLIVEALTGLLFVAAWLRFGAGLLLIAVIVLMALFIVISITSIENRLMPVIFYYGSIVIALAFAALQPLTHSGPAVVESLLGLAVGAGLSALVWLLFEQAGSKINSVYILISGMIGASIGFPFIVPVLVADLLIGLAWQIIYRPFMPKNATAVPFAAILCCLALIVIFVGS